MKLVRISAIWCSSCILTYSAWSKIKDEYPNFEYIEYDFDNDHNKFLEYNIGTVLPVILILNGDKEIGRIVGEKNFKEISVEIDRVMKS